MTEKPATRDASCRMADLAGEIFAELAAQFPVCLSSDEFHFFPQFKSDTDADAEWEDFSKAGIRRFQSKVSQWLSRLDQLRGLRPAPSMEAEVDMLSRVLITLEEQLSQVRPQQTQPTFYLSIVSIGLAEALEASHDAFARRIQTLPQFLKAAGANLLQVPQVFRDLALDMVPRLQSWIRRLPLADAERRLVMAALDDYREHLFKIDTNADFRLRQEVYARIADFHMGTQMGTDEIAWHLDKEIETTALQLEASAASLSPGDAWQKVFHQLPAPAAAENDAAGLYKSGIARLKQHCLEHDFADQAVTADCDVAIETIPEHMMPVRANAAYSMPPGHPPKGGVFYIMPLNRQPIPTDMMLLAAHETFPGHHLLDTHRWFLHNPVRRSLEFPLFYEGWACFSEEILFDTDFFSGPVDQLLMAKRRYWRAQRGRADLRIHTGQSSLEEAAAELSAVGLVSRRQALAMVRRYALKPGYQLAYTIGRNKFRQLYTAFAAGGGTPGQFVRKVMSHGEIGFDHLAKSVLY